MANKYTYQVLRDSTTDCIVKITGTFDGSGDERNNQRIPANTFSGALATNGYLLANSTTLFANTALPYYDLQLTGMKSYVNFSLTSGGGGGGGSQGVVELLSLIHI